jgi:hypothetical protein
MPNAKRSIQKSLGPGLHAGTVELEAGGSYRVRLASGGHVRACLDVGLAPEFVDACMKTGRKVLLEDSDRGPRILGAIEAPQMPPSGEAHVAVEGGTIRLRAKDAIAIEVGKSTLRLDKTGALRIEGRKMVLDVASLVRFLSARVELP